MLFIFDNSLIPYNIYTIMENFKKIDVLLQQINITMTIVKRYYSA